MLIALKPQLLPNFITVLRILLAPLIVWLIVKDHYREALLLFIIAGVSDGVDGFLAKHFDWTSQLGGFLDPLADKLLLVGTVLALGWQDELPFWLVFTVIARDVMIVTLALSYHYFVAPIKAEPLVISKLNTLMQLTLVATVLLSKGMLPLPYILIGVLVYATGLTTLVSGGAYLWKWGVRALHEGRRGSVS